MQNPYCFCFFIFPISWITAGDVVWSYNIVSSLKSASIQRPLKKIRRVPLRFSLCIWHPFRSVWARLTRGRNWDFDKTINSWISIQSKLNRFYLTLICWWQCPPPLYKTVFLLYVTFICHAGGRIMQNSNYC